MARLLTRRSTTTTVQEVPDRDASRSPEGGSARGDRPSTAQYAAGLRDAARERLANDVTPRVLAARESARASASTARGAALDARSSANTRAREVGGKINGDLAPRLVALLTGAVAAAQQTGTSAADQVRDRATDVYTAARNRIAPPPPPPRRKRAGAAIGALALVGGAVAGWQVWSKRRKDDSWDLPTYSTPAAPAPTSTATPRVPASDAAGSGVGEAMSDRQETLMSNRDPDRVDLPGDRTEEDETGASTSPRAVRSDEGPGISDTDDPARRAAAGQAGRAAFEQASGQSRTERTDGTGL